MNDIEQALADVKCELPIRESIGRIVAAHPCQLYAGKPGTYVPLVTCQGRQVAVYANRTTMDFALDPAQAREWAQRLDLATFKAGQKVTHYVRITAAQVNQPAVRKQITELAGVAFMRNANRKGRKAKESAG